MEKSGQQFNCPVEATLSLIGGKYKPLILWHLIEGPLHYMELQRRIPTATPKMLAQQLRALEACGMLRREVVPEKPPKTLYSLTEFGRTAVPVLEAMCDWGKSWMERPAETPCAWAFRSEDDRTVSLHDCLISDVRCLEDWLILYFEDGFDVERENPANLTGRHRHTGPAAVYLEHGRFFEGAFDRNVVESVKSADGTFRDIPLPERPMTEELFCQGEPDIMVYGFTWDRKEKHFTVDGSADREPDGGFCKIIFACDRAVFCWNDLPRDAWFQRWPHR